MCHNLSLECSCWAIERLLLYQVSTVREKAAYRRAEHAELRLSQVEVTFKIRVCLIAAACVMALAGVGGVLQVPCRLRPRQPDGRRRAMVPGMDEDDMNEAPAAPSEGPREAPPNEASPPTRRAGVCWARSAS